MFIIPVSVELHSCKNTITFHGIIKIYRSEKAVCINIRLQETVLKFGEFHENVVNVRKPSSCWKLVADGSVCCLLQHRHHISVQLFPSFVWS